MGETLYPHQGEIYLIRPLKSLGDTKKRPAVVISLNVRNQFSSSVLVVPFSSDLSGGITPTRILIPQGEGGLSKDSLALCDNISAIRKIHLEQGPYGAISSIALEQIQKAVQIAIGVFIL
ncbi:type II toxin-antitoxin system PemK/MazF family toxin [Synechocystis sp. PCC 7339]|uniref:type II toxin-antitoxin system PemK/MazF family toxin n=1 Tax=unclassified Synechocystis TaxID=2640012 RepID=UPI001BB0B745|nr:MULTISPECIES: type II toxin-antitoxin system PemK/MazF family toxin [unclassified Synechocystis]QUS60751.1 type II toxin-antitoxin system PemK/MazF family toxin [Synechocystis sp. PCC 7338]UAJ72936.1 type II toxin-antitoxin system PemK/MazF family toxin [Synechocystis sp. PCC 7339]